VASGLISDEKFDYTFLIGNNDASNVWVGNIYQIGFTSSVTSASTISSGYNECITANLFRSPQFGCIETCPFGTFKSGNNCFSCDRSCNGCTGEGNANCSECA
jgi:hypothetical protein